MNSSVIVDLAMGQMPRSTERISSVTKVTKQKSTWNNATTTTEISSAMTHNASSGTLNRTDICMYIRLVSWVLFAKWDCSFWFEVQGKVNRPW